MLTPWFVIVTVLLAPIGGFAKSPEASVETLANPKASEKTRSQAEQTLYRHGVQAIPILISHLKDDRMAGKEPAIFGQCINLPIHETPPKECLNPTDRAITLGKRCEEILYRILTPPAYSSPYAKGRERGKLSMEQPFLINDWKKWWRRHQNESLEELQTQAKKLIDKFWRRGWGKGPVTWR